MCHKVILDTNIFHKERTDSSRMQMLLRLVKSGDVELVIPEVVAREHVTKRVSEAEKLRESIRSDIRKLKSTKVCGDDYVFSMIDSTISNSIKEIESDFENWLSLYGLELYKIGNTSIADIFDDYFSGGGAFKEIKSRQDFPDAVILDCIKKIATDNTTFFVTEDKNLASACRKVENCVVKPSLNELLEVPVFNEKLKELNGKDTKINEILNLIKSTRASMLFEDYIKEYQQEEIFHYEFYFDVIEPPYEMDEVFSDYENEDIQAKIVEFENGGNLFLASSEYLGDGKYSVSFSMECTVELHVFGSEDDYEKLSYDYRKEISFDNNPKDHSEIHMHGEFLSEINCNIIISGIKESLDSSAIETHLEYLGSEKCELNVELEFVKLSLNYI
ncbi:PIN domain-containing protein [Marinomonas sp. GJ51-6]|uniref:PIN domain-containing protein n=1 Tax=Marinomonas sp. GJ51-6 TaxID=2992802 RepID=UPI002934FF34|nr:PIN domain-containing protein [Marinomonas sp. GJ51-6]WOD08616.1 PIN domain-containing protein [Marinomonas sp. GJ51-6]